MAGHNNWPYVINLGNSIIGVAVLAMPFCFKQCGIILAMLVLLFCTWLTLASCQLLMKAGIASRRRSYEFLAYFTHGATGKFLSEVGMIGMQVGTLIAQIVVIGDLGPAIISKLFGLENTSNLRITLIIVLCLCVGLPLGLLKDLRTVSRASTVCISFYTIFILYVIFLSLPNLWSGSWYPHIRFWRFEGLFQCLPILSFSFGCQTQLFFLYDALPEPSLKAISSVISSAVNLCAVAYLVVGFFGCVTFYAVEVPGDVLAIFPSTLFADVMKLCFVFSIVITFPVIIFPCRASIYTLLFSKKTKLHDDNIEGEAFMSEKLFKGITISIVIGSMITGILIPNVEFILGINGAIVGTLICYIFPALFFLKVAGTKTEGKVIAQVVLVLGVSIMLLSSYATLSSHDKGHSHIESPKDIMDHDQMAKVAPATHFQPAKAPNVPDDSIKDIDSIGDVAKKKEIDEKVEDKRHEPPNPNPPDSIEPDIKKKKNASVLKVSESAPNLEKPKINAEKPQEKNESENNAKVEKLQEKEKKQEELIHELEKHRDEQEKLLKEQREVLKELKNHQEDDLKEEEKESQKEAVDPLQNKIVDQQQQIINQQQKVIEQQQEQLKQQENANKAPAQGGQLNPQLPLNNQQQQPLVNQQDQLNQQQPVLNQRPEINQHQPLVNQQLQVNQQQPFVNKQPQVNQQLPLVNNLPQVNQQQPLENQQPQVNQQQPLGNQPLQVNQQRPLENQQPQVNQQQPLGNQQPQINQQQPLGNQPLQVNQQQPLRNQPLQVNQQQPLGNQQPQVNQQQPLGNQPLQVNQQQPLGNQQPLVNQQQPLGNQPLQVNQQQPLGNQQPQINQQQPLGNQQPQVNQQQPLGNQPLQVNQQQPLGNQQPLVNQQQPLGNKQLQMHQQQPLANQNQPPVNQQPQLNQQPPIDSQQVQIKTEQVQLNQLLKQQPLKHHRKVDDKNRGDSKQMK